MEKEELISELKTRIGETILSERSLTEYAESIISSLPSEGEIPESFWKTNVSILKSMEGQLRFEKAQFAKSFEEQWKREHPEQPKPDGGKKDDDNNGKNPMEEMIQKFIEAQKAKDDNLSKQLETYSNTIKAMQDKLDAKEKQERTAETKAAVSKALRAIGEVNEGVLKYAINEIDFESGKSVEALAEEAKASYSRIYKEMFGDSGIPFHGAEGSDKDSTIVNSFIKQIQEADKKQAEKMEMQKKQLI